ncbi:hypothetical protein [Methylobacter svalbardensis]|uniref:hypothetical protein n=1 Tax=Methylobacter svalbardensis TaxID=3080016 RepID=UPI0030EEF691
MSFDQAQVAGLIRKIGAADQLLAEAYINGTLFVDEKNQPAIDSLKKSGLLRIAEQSDEFRLSTDIKRLIDRLLLRNPRYRQNTDIAKTIGNVAEDIDAYRAALEQNEPDEANYHLEQIDDSLYESLELLENSLSVMFTAITSQFGFVNSLSSKIRENERALAYAQQLVTELSIINTHDCYEWISCWAAPTELSHKVIRFIDQYKSIVVRLVSIVDRMKTLLFTLRLQEQTANRTRAMAQFLKKHPEWQPREWCDENIVPALLKRDQGLIFNTGINTKKSSHQDDLIQIIQELKRQSNPIKLLDSQRDAISVDSTEPEPIEYRADYYEAQIENLFSLALEKQGHKVSALQYWQTSQLQIRPELWLDSVFAQYCCLQQRFKQTLDIEMDGQALPDFNGNQLITEIWLRRVQ